MNITDYTGSPYRFRDYNCWHHVTRVRADQGIYTPPFDVRTPVDIPDVFDAGRANAKGLERVTAPRNYDAVLMGARIAGRIIWHAGIYFDGMVSHCERAAKQVRLETLADVKERYPEIEFWR